MLVTLFCFQNALELLDAAIGKCSTKQLFYTCGKNFLKITRDVVCFLVKLHAEGL